MNHPEIFERITKMTPEQRERLACMTELLINIIENPHLPAMLVRVIPSKPEAETEVVVAHCLCHSMDDAATMLQEFTRARAAMDIAQQVPTNQQRH